MLEAQIRVRRDFHITDGNSKQHENQFKCLFGHDLPAHEITSRVVGEAGIGKSSLLVALWAYPGFVDGIVLGSNRDSRLTVLELHG